MDVVLIWPSWSVACIIHVSYFVILYLLCCLCCVYLCLRIPCVHELHAQRSTIWLTSWRREQKNFNAPLFVCTDVNVFHIWIAPPSPFVYNSIYNYNVYFRWTQMDSNNNHHVPLSPFFKWGSFFYSPATCTDLG